ncbi:hypothetical protein OG413_25215 [Streptomyces sp. NBC_01433]|uniref:hypothetical protein n=1 Tax=Streptomyces sp. NBC_01433 TaxID=2903864 RepID=UPI00224F431E|nr:hypothetical protein [Streptomyces sp. NBC_01433]MCX4678567.1 hypothetical protein [Streptomyces sp. NBC_01433]
MNAVSSPDTGFVVTTSPPEPCAGRPATVHVDIRLHHRPVSKITLTLPVGSEKQHLVTVENADLIEPVLGTDYHFTAAAYNPFSPSSNEPYWTVGTPEKTTGRVVFTLTPHHTEQHTTDHLHLDLVDVHLNTVPGSVALTLTTYTGGTPTPTMTTLTKLTPGLKLDNLQATGKATHETRNVDGKDSPVTKVRHDTPILLTWTAQDAKTLTLTRGNGQPISLRADQRAYPDPVDPEAEPLTLTDDTKFTLAATGDGDTSATKDIYLSVYQPDGQYNDLAVTGTLTLPPVPAPTTRRYWLTADLKFEARTDGYYRVGLFLYSRFYGCFPPAKDMARRIPTRVEVGGASFLCGNLTSDPLTVFAPAGTVLTVKKPEMDPSSFFFSYFPAVTVTWVGHSAEDSLPAEPVQKIYEVFPAKGKVPLCAAQNASGTDSENPEMLLETPRDSIDYGGYVQIWRTMKTREKVSQTGVVWRTGPKTAKTVTTVSGDKRREFDFPMTDEITGMSMKLETITHEKVDDPLLHDFTKKGPFHVHSDNTHPGDRFYYGITWNPSQYPADSGIKSQEFHSVHVSTASASTVFHVNGKTQEKVNTFTPDEMPASHPGPAAGSHKWDDPTLCVAFTKSSGTRDLKLTDLQSSDKSGGPDPSINLLDTADGFTIPGTDVHIAKDAEYTRPIPLVGNWAVTAKGLWEGDTLRTPPDAY